MTKKQIKSVYHWSLMGLIMGLPLLITLFSYIPNAYNENNVIAIENATPSAEIKQYETNEITTVADLVDGNIYKVKDYSVQVNLAFAYKVFWHFDENTTVYECESGFYTENGDGYFMTDNIEEYEGRFTDGETYWVYKKAQNEDIHVSFLTVSDWLPTYYVDKTTTTQYVVNNGAYQVYEFNQWFVGLPINSWYNEIINLIGATPTSYTPMANTIYLPLYCIYVLVFDLAYDVLAFVPSIIHGFLDRTKGESE